VLDDLPEAVDRLCAAAEARAAVGGDESLRRDLVAELSREGWRRRMLPKTQVQRLRAIAGDAAQPAPWRSAAALLLESLVSETP
jgi:hypothetical protein